MSARGRPGARLVALVVSRVTIGSRKAYVLPEPVRPRPSTSRPASESGRVAAWMGNGLSMPRTASTSARTLGTPSSAKVAPTRGSAIGTIVGAVFGAAFGMAFDVAFDTAGRVAVRGVDVAVTRG